jgi:hypothetical protein
MENAMVMVVDELAFTEINTLMTVAREAADRVIETSARFVREAQAKTPNNLDAHGRQNPPCVAPLHLLGEDTYGVRNNRVNMGEEPIESSHLPTQEGRKQTREDKYHTEWVPTDAQEFSRNTATRPREWPDGKPPQRPVPDPQTLHKYSEAVTHTIISDAQLGVVKETEKSPWWCHPVPYVPISNGKTRSVVALVQLNKFIDHPRSWEETSNDKKPQRWSGATMNQKDINLMRKTMSVWPSLVDVDGRFLPNPINITDNYSMIPPETKRDDEPPLRDAADRDYGGEETTVPPTQLQRVKRRKLDLAAEPRVSAKRCFTTPTMSRGGLTTRPNQLTVRKMWCCPEPGERDGAWWRPIQNFPRCNAWSAVTEALPERCGVEALLEIFWLLTRGCIRKRSKQQTSESQIVNSRTTKLEMNRHVSSENNCEAWVATRKRDLAELQRLNV